MCSLLMRLQRSTSLFNFGWFAASLQREEVNQKAQIAAAIQNERCARMKGVMNRTFRAHSSSWPTDTLSARVGQLDNVHRSSDITSHGCIPVTQQSCRRQSSRFRVFGMALHHQRALRGKRPSRSEGARDTLIAFLS